MILEEQKELEEDQEESQFEIKPIQIVKSENEPPVKFEKVQLQIFGPQSQLDLEDQFYIKLKVRHAID